MCSVLWTAIQQVVINRYFNPHTETSNPQTNVRNLKKEPDTADFTCQKTAIDLLFLTGNYSPMTNAFHVQLCRKISSMLGWIIEHGR